MCVTVCHPNYYTVALFGQTLNDSLVCVCVCLLLYCTTVFVGTLLNSRPWEFFGSGDILERKSTFWKTTTWEIVHFFGDICRFYVKINRLL